MNPRARMVAAIVAATLVNLPFGTIYAFSVFLKPMEAMLAIGRTQMGFVFGLATVSLTVGMNVAPRLYRRLPPDWLLFACGAFSAVGLGLTAQASGYAELVIGYGLLFGFGGGIAFTLLQQAVIQASIRPSGLVNGYVVGLYPLGAMIGAPVFGWAIGVHGLRATLAGLGVTLALSSLVAALLLRRAAVRMHDATQTAHDAPIGQRPTFLMLFGVFFLAAAAGLMVLSQAAGIVQAYGGASGLALGATTFITGLIAAARIGGGAMVDRFAPPQVGAGAHLLSLAGALALIAWPGPQVAVLGLALIGAGYGLVSGLTVGALPRYWHRNLFGRIASRMYIAWCFAAISLPVLAGWIFDRTQGYAAAVMVAAGGNVLGLLVALRLPRGNAAESNPRGAPS